MRTWMLFLGGLVAAGALALPGEAEAQTRNRLIWFADEGGGANETYWIGVQAVPAPAVLRSHLKLKHGLLIEHVLPEGPAAEAGFAEGDILLTVGGEEVSDVKQLHDALQKSKGEAVSAVLLHEGEEREVKIAPAKRETPRGLVVGEGEPVERWLRGLRGAEGEDPIRMFLFRPGAVFGVPAGEELPANVKIEITKSGKEPAKITVTQGEEKWEATSEDLSALPEKIRTHVERMVGNQFQGRIEMHTPPEGETRSLPRIRIQAEPGEVVPGRRLVPEETQRQHEALRPRIEPGSEYQERIENLERKVEELREQLEGLRGSRDSKKPAEESTET